jgi:hypothetical protein
MDRSCVLLALCCGAAAALGDEPCGRKNALVFYAGLAIDADGAPNAYGPNGRGLDALANAGKPGSWWALATRDDGEPIVQGPSDPAPGFYVSTTALEDRAQPKGSVARYVDSAAIPYVVLPPSKLKEGARLGDFAAVVNEASGKIVYAIVADVGREGKLGEGSMALAEALGLPSDPRRGGTRATLRYVVFTHSGNGKPRSRAEIDREGERLYRDPSASCIAPGQR